MHRYGMGLNMNQMNEINIKETLCDCLEKKLAIFQHYLSITKQMKHSIEETKEKQLRRQILERQYCIKKIRNIDESIKKILSKTQSKTSFNSHIYNGSVRHYINKIQEIIETITPLDKELRTQVNSECNDLKTALLRIQHTRKAARGYGKKTEYSPRLIDARS